MILTPNSPLIRYTGRWNVGETEAVSTANGSYAEFAFSGECAVVEFGVDHCTVPFPRVYIAVDGGAKVEVPIDRFIRISADDSNLFAACNREIAVFVFGKNHTLCCNFTGNVGMLF